MQQNKNGSTGDVMTLNRRFAEFREAHFSLVDQWIFQDEKEILDEESNTAQAVQVVNELDRLNHLFLYPLLVSRLIKNLSAFKKKQPLTIVDVCTGYGGFCRFLAARMEKKKLSLRILGIDDSCSIIQAASHLPNPQNVTFGVADACDLPFKDCEFDLALNIYSLHHFDAEAVVRVLQEGARVARGLFIYDLRRNMYGFITSRFNRLFFSHEFTHDAVISNRRAYSIKEMRFLVREAGIGANVKQFGNGLLIESQS